MLAIDLPPELEARLQRMADESGRSKAECAREAIIGFFEDQDDVRIATERLKAPGRTWSLSELEQGIDLDR